MIILLLIVLSGILSNPAFAIVQRDTGGLSVSQFRSFSKSLPELPGRIEAVRLFTAVPGHAPSIAVLTLSTRSGWHIFIFNPTPSQYFRLGWKSGKLDDAFSVSSPEELRVFSFLDGSQGIEFTGCAPHVCGNPGVFAVLLYVPIRNKAFSAISVYGNVTYSGDLMKPDNRKFKSDLDNLVKELASQ